MADWKDYITRALEGGFDAIAGLLDPIGISPETPANKAGQLLGAGLPVIGGLKGAIKGVRNLSNLPLDEASRMARAKEQGFTNPLYHGTRLGALKGSGDFTEFRDPITPTLPLQGGGVAQLGDFGIHMSPDPRTAAKFTGFTQHPSWASEGGRIMPLMVRMDQTLELPDMGMWNSAHHWRSGMSGPGVNQAGFSKTAAPRVRDMSGNPEMVDELYEIVSKSAAGDRYAPNRVDENLRFQQDIKDALTKGGYDSIQYRNLIEGTGEPSFLHLDPRKIRSRFANFDPSKLGSKDIMAGLAGAGIAGAIARPSGESR